MNKILQKSKLFMSKVSHFKNEIQKIHQAIQACEMISLLDSLVINLVFSMRNIKILQIIPNKKAKR